MSRIYPGRNPQCPRCLTHPGTYMHMFWSCPMLSSFWAEIFDQLNVRLELNVPMTPELALLGVHDDDQRSHHSKLLISYLLFYAKKEILCKWTSSVPPDVATWENKVNAALPMYKLTYINRGCPWKFDKVWSSWASI